MKKSSLILLAIFSAVISFDSHFPNLTIPKTSVVGKDSIVTITISATGDLMCHSVQYNYAKVANDSFDFNPVFDFVKEIISKSDFAFGNLETVLAGTTKNYSGYPFFNTPNSFVEALKNAGFDLLVTSNNHSLDRGEDGILRTIKELDKMNLNHTGTFATQSDRDSIRIIDIKGIRLGVIAYSYGTNGNPIPTHKQYLINIIDEELIASDIKKARKDGAEIVLVNFHFGEEYQREPNLFQEEVVRKTIDAGADIIIGGHPHVIQPVRIIKTSNAKLDSGFVAYSLGNFISNQRWRYSDAGVILTLSLTKIIATDSIFISNIEYHPVWVFKGDTNLGKRYIIVTENKIDYNFISGENQIAMKEAFSDTHHIFSLFDKRFISSKMNF
ncbi:MAG: CapA family protein [Ignavibacteriales bacterium]|nr:CapA family protein [Ignavibacteriales bacterium]